MAQTECAIFEEDEVCKRINDRIIYGIVTESSEFLSSDEEEDDEDVLSRGTVRILWHPNGSETVEEEKKVTLVDRSLMPGDVVRHISGKNNQRGYVQDLDVKCHLHIKGSNKYIYNVDAKDLLPLREFDFDDDVTLDPWYGKVEVTTMQARVVFPDGAQCIAEEENLFEMDMSLEDSDTEQELYPGTVLKGERSTLKDVEWIHETKINNHRMSSSKNVNVRIEESLVGSVQINWICRGFNTVSDCIKLQQPNIIVREDIHKLKKLGKFQHCSTQINDVLMYTIKDTDNLSELVPGSDNDRTINQNYNTTSNNSTPGSDPSSEVISNGKTETLQEITERCNESLDGITCSSLHSKDNDIRVCTLTDVMVNVNCEEGMDDSLDISAVDEIVEEDDNDVEYEDIPDQAKEKCKRLQKRSAKGKRKKKKVMEFQTKFPECRARETVPVAVFCTLSMATVMWQDGSVEKDISSTELYPIHHLDEQEFFPGDFVVEAKEKSEKVNYYGAIVSCDHHARTCMVNWYKIENGTNIRTSESSEEVSVYDIKDHPDYKFRPGDIVVAVGDPNKSDVGYHAVGQISCLDSQGGLFVKWPDNTTSFCNPQELYLVGGDMSEYDSDSDSSDFSSDSDESWETEEEEEAESETHEETKKPTTVKKEELESLLDRATAALSKLDDLFRTLPQSIDATQYFQEIIYIYKKCRELEKILKSSFYKDEEIVNLIEEAKKQLRKSRTEKYNRRIEELSKQLKEVSQNLEVELNGVMTTIPVTGDGNKQEGSQNIENGVPYTRAINNENTEVVQSESDTGRTGNKMETWTSNEMLVKLNSIEIMAENDLHSLQNICENGNDLGRTEETIHRYKEGDGKTSDGKEYPLQCTKRGDHFETAETCAKGSGIDLETQTLCLKICGHLQDRMKTILEEVVPQWMAEGNILINDEMCKKTSQMYMSEEIISSSDTEPLAVLSDVQEVTSSPVDIVEITEETTISRFIQESEVPLSQKFYGQHHVPTNLKTFMTTVNKEMRLLQRCLPEGITVRGYEDRMDLYSVMIIGPKKTPYEDVPFFFDIQLPNDYPKSPPIFHYISFCTDRLNPNLYDDGKVCVSLLGTWEGKDTERWTSNSSLLQVLVSIQGLILVDEPYYNEAGYEKHRGTQQGAENSQMYNEMAIIKLVESLTNMLKNIPESFETECVQHLIKFGPRIIQRFVYWSTNPYHKRSEEPVARFSLEQPDLKTTLKTAKIKETNVTTSLNSQKTAEVKENNGNTSLISQKTAEVEENNGNTSLNSQKTAEVKENNGSTSLNSQKTAEVEENNGNTSLNSQKTAEVEENNGNTSLNSQKNAEVGENNGNTSLNSQKTAEVKENNGSTSLNSQKTAEVEENNGNISLNSQKTAEVKENNGSTSLNSQKTAEVEENNGNTSINSQKTAEVEENNGNTSFNSQKTAEVEENNGNTSLNSQKTAEVGENNGNTSFDSQKTAEVKENNGSTSLNSQKTAEVKENNGSTSLNSQKTAEVEENNGNTSLNSQKTAEVKENNGSTSLNSQKTAEVEENNGNTSLNSQKTAEVKENNGNTSLNSQKTAEVKENNGSTSLNSQKTAEVEENNGNTSLNSQKTAEVKENNGSTSLNSQKTAEVKENNGSTSLNSQKTAEVEENNGNTSLNSQKTAEVKENNGSTSLNSQKTAEVEENNGNTSLNSQKTAEVKENNGSTSLNSQKTAEVEENNGNTSLNSQKTAEVKENNGSTSLNSQKTAEVEENNGNTSLNSQKTAEVGENNGNTSLNSQKTAEVKENNGSTSLNSQKTAEVGENNGNTSLNSQKTAEVGENNRNTSLNSQKTAEVEENNGNTSLNSQKTAEVKENNGSTSLNSQKTAEVGETNGSTFLKKTDTLANKKIAILSSNTQVDVPVSLLSGTDLYMDISSQSHKPISILQLANEKLGDRTSTNQTSDKTSVLSVEDISTDSDYIFQVEFPLFPLSRGFCITMTKKLSTLKTALYAMMESQKLKL